MTLIAVRKRAPARVISRRSYTSISLHRICDLIHRGLRPTKKITRPTHPDKLCVPRTSSGVLKVRLGNIGDEGHQEQGEM